MITLVLQYANETENYNRVGPMDLPLPPTDLHPRTPPLRLRPLSTVTTDRNPPPPPAPDVCRRTPRVLEEACGRGDPEGAVQFPWEPHTDPTPTPH